MLVELNLCHCVFSLLLDNILHINELILQNKGIIKIKQAACILLPVLIFNTK